MKRRWIGLMVCFFGVGGMEASATTHYVKPYSKHPISPYTSWETAAMSIQAAVDVAGKDDTVELAEGTYTLLSEVSVSTDMTITGPSGKFAATVSGGGTTRCFSLDVNCTLRNLTIQEGSGVNGGGVFCGSSYNVRLENCIFKNNTASGSGGGLQGGTAVNCRFYNNSADNYGGGMNGGTAQNCFFSGNQALYGGGKSGGTAENCIFSGNSATSGGAICYTTAQNCTIVSNSCTSNGSGTFEGVANNCIVWANSGPSGQSWLTASTNTCGNSTHGLNGCITNNPVFIDLAHGNYHLFRESPCIDAGTNALVATTEDYDGNDRIYRWGSGGIVDMGAYEVTGSQVTTFYVDQSCPTPAYPYATLASAATNIQDAVDQTRNGDTVQVYPGHYLDTPITVDTDILMRGLTDAVSGQRPIIDGRRIECCLYIDSTSCQIENLVFTNACGLYGGGAHCSTCDPVFEHCTFINNLANRGGGLYAGTATNCLFESNKSTMYGGATYSTRAYNCNFFNNKADYAGGGGAYTLSKNCLFTNNISVYGGGAYKGMTTQSVFRANSAWKGGGTYSTQTHSCLIVENSAHIGGGVYLGIIWNSTITGNMATNEFGGVYSSNGVFNSIIWYNTAASGNDLYSTSNDTANICSPDVIAGAQGQITNAPAFVDRAQGDYHLCFYSPCIDEGCNQASTLKDLDGNPRISNGNTDLGAYEFQHQPGGDTDGDGLSDDWEMQYWNGDAEATADDDGDAYDNLHEYIAGTIPTNAASLLSANGMATPSGFELNWTAIYGRSYRVEWTESLTNTVWSESALLPYPQDSYVDTEWSNQTNRFYRISVQKNP